MPTRPIGEAVTMSVHPLLSRLDRIYVINLPSRYDRRAEMAAQLARVGTGFNDPKVTLFAAIRPEAPGRFPSIGACGCFLSHLGVLKDARAQGAEQILLLEDDADFAQPFLAVGEKEARALQGMDWGMAYLGYRASEPLGAAVGDQTAYAIAPPPTRLVTSHAILFRKAAIVRLIPYLEAMLGRPGGDPAGGPMHVDGAYSWFRKANPDLRTVVTRVQWAVQRSSRTDIAEAGWKEHLPLISKLRWLRNRLRRTQTDP